MPTSPSISGAAKPSSPAMSAPRFFCRLVRGRWFMVLGCLYIMSASGATYIFSAYSKALKSALNYNQETLNTISFFKDLGGNFGILSGLIMEVIPPSAVLAIGAAMNLGGYLMIYLAMTGRTAPPPVWAMCIYICLGANSQAFANTGALVTAVKNFPASRGIVIGLLKGFVGLSGALYTQLYLAFYGDGNAADLVLLIAWLPAAISVVFVHTVRYIPYSRGGGGGGGDIAGGPFFCFLYISIALAVYLLTIIIVEKQVAFSHAAYAAAAAGLLVILALPAAVVVKQELKSPEPSPLPVVTAPPPVITAPAPATIAVLPERAKNLFRAPARGEDYTILQAMFSIDMAILFTATLCGVGGTLTAIDNMGQIGQSQGYAPASVNTFVSLISIWNYAGRVAAGFASEIFLAKYRFPRPLMVTFVLLLSTAGHLLIAFAVPNGLYAASVVIGFCFGAQWPLVFAIISEIFGLKYYSTLYNFGGIASPIGAYILNVRVAGVLYDREAARQRGGKLAGDKTCLGVNCFKNAFLIIAGCTVLGAVVSLVLVWRTKDFYKGDIYAKFRDAAAAPEAAAGEKPESAPVKEEKKGDEVRKEER